VIHYFSKVFQDPAYNPLGKPWLFTVEGNGQPAEVFPVNTVFISRDHARRHGSSVFVYNGVNPDGYTMARSRRPYACFLAKARWPVKNVDGAISVAKRAQMPLKIMGGYRFSFSRWVRWLGMADQAQKTAVLGEARALLFPVRWHEPFGIAVVEGLLSGAPVFGTPYGSLPELVTEDVGSLASSTDELARMLAARVVNPRICRDYAASRFSHVVMAEGYTKLYDRILAGQDLHVVAPQTISERPPEELLPWT
jgi:glycosyltransferase involved in cell wall biosynthesis